MAEYSWDSRASIDNVVVTEFVPGSGRFSASIHPAQHARPQDLMCLPDAMRKEFGPDSVSIEGVGRDCVMHVRDMPDASSICEIIEAQGIPLINARTRQEGPAQAQGQQR